MGGLTAEELIFKERTSGAHEDIELATKIAHSMVTDLGMSDKLGPRTFGDKQEMVFLGREIAEQKDYGDKVADTIDEEVNRIIQSAHRAARKILIKNNPKLIQIAEKLIAQETLEGEGLESLFSESTSATIPEATAASAPTPTAASAKTKPVSKKTRVSPRLLPKQAPAST